ncbi:MAG: hypothetical protein ACTSPY_07850 [Candidatus Helarchaeota archaeon]
MLKNKFKKIHYLFIILPLYLPDLLLIITWVYDLILQVYSMDVYLINYYFFSHSFLIWISASIIMFIVSIFLGRVKEFLFIIGGIYIHLGLDVFRPFVDFSNIPINLGLSPYHFVNLIYPYSISGIPISIFIPDYLIWVIDFGILLLGILIFLSQYSKEGIIAPSNYF